MADVDDLTRRVAVHRAAWDGSKMTEARYADIMRTWPYRPDLDCVLESRDGELVASALAWFDPNLALGELEPVGTHRDHRRKGFARAVNLYALQQLRRAGATQAIVGSRGDDDYPIPKALYRSVGFRELSRQTPYVKNL
jgi:ribosomal protein S18 acetylase RimI-like enzyme